MHTIIKLRIHIVMCALTMYLALSSTFLVFLLLHSPQHIPVDRGTISRWAKLIHSVCVCVVARGPSVHIHCPLSSFP